MNKKIKSIYFSTLDEYIEFQNTTNYTPPVVKSATDSTSFGVSDL